MVFNAWVFLSSCCSDKALNKYFDHQTNQVHSPKFEKAAGIEHQSLHLGHCRSDDNVRLVVAMQELPGRNDYL